MGDEPSEIPQSEETLAQLGSDLKEQVNPSITFWETYST